MLLYVEHELHKGPCRKLSPEAHLPDLRLRHPYLGVEVLVPSQNDKNSCTEAPLKVHVVRVATTKNCVTSHRTTAAHLAASMRCLICRRDGSQSLDKLIAERYVVHIATKAIPRPNHR